MAAVPIDQATADEATVDFVRSIAAWVHSPPIPSRSAITCCAAAELLQPCGSGSMAHHQPAKTATISDQASRRPMKRKSFTPTRGGRSSASIMGSRLDTANYRRSSVWRRCRARAQMATTIAQSAPIRPKSNQLDSVQPAARLTDGFSSESATIAPEYGAGTFWKRPPSALLSR